MNVHAILLHFAERCEVTVRYLPCRDGPAVAPLQPPVIVCGNRYDSRPNILNDRHWLLHRLYLFAPMLVVKPMGRCLGAAGVINSRIAERVALIASS